MKMVGLLGFLCATTIATMPLSMAAEPPVDRPFLFSLEKDGHVSFLFGTQHSNSTQGFPNYFFRAILSQNVLATEVTAKSLSKAELAALPPLTTIPFPKPQTVEILRARGIPDSLFTSPLICSLYYSWELEKDGHFMEKELDDFARSHGKKLSDLEEPSAIQVMDKDFYAKASSCKIDDIVISEAQSEEFKHANEMFVATYRSGDLNKVFPSTGFDQDRTKSWIPKIETIHKQGAFFAVGVGHLVGPEGLLALLAADGFHIRRISSETELSQALAVNQN